MPDLPPENASAEEKARILKERRRIKERIREQQRDRSSPSRPSAAEESARRAKQREEEMTQRMLAEARRLQLPRVDDNTFDRLARLTTECMRLHDFGMPNSLELSQLEDEWQAVVPGHELPMTGEVHYGTATSTQEDGTEEVSNVYVGDGVNTQTFELRHEFFFGGHVEYALAIGHNSIRLDGVLYMFNKRYCKCKDCSKHRSDPDAAAVLGLSPSSTLVHDDQYSPSAVYVQLQGVNRITVWPGCQEERMLDPDAIWIADENTCVDGPKGRTVPKWLA